MSERFEADVARGYFRSNNQPEKRLVLTGALASGVLGLLAFTGCNGNEDVSANPTPSPESTQVVLTPTPQETLIVHEQPYTSIPPVPTEFRDSAEAIMGYWKERRLEGNRFKLVVNESYELDVIGLAGIPENTSGLGSTTVYVKAESVETAFGIRRQACADILEAGGPEAAKIDVHFNIIVPNAGTDPFSETGFTEQQRKEFLTPAICEVTS